MRHQPPFISEARDTYQVALAFDVPPGLSVVLEMPHVPATNACLGIIFLGNMVTETKWPSGLYEVVRSVPGISPEERYAGAIALRRCSADGSAPKVAEEWFVVSVP